MEMEILLVQEHNEQPGMLEVIFGIVSLWWQNGISSVNPKDVTLKLFVIPKGTAIRIIGNDLKSQGLIKDPVVFFLYIKKNGLDKNMNIRKTFFW